MLMQVVARGKEALKKKMNLIVKSTDLAWSKCFKLDFQRLDCYNDNEILRLLLVWSRVFGFCPEVYELACILYARSFDPIRPFNQRKIYAFASLIIAAQSFNEEELPNLGSICVLLGTDVDRFKQTTRGLQSLVYTIPSLTLFEISNYIVQVFASYIPTDDLVLAANHYCFKCQLCFAHLDCNLKNPILLSLAVLTCSLEDACHDMAQVYRVAKKLQTQFDISEQLFGECKLSVKEIIDLYLDGRDGLISDIRIPFKYGRRRIIRHRNARHLTSIPEETIFEFEDKLMEAKRHFTQLSHSLQGAVVAEE